GGTADALDVVESTGTVVFDPGITRRSIRVRARHDALVENSETLVLRLGPVRGGGSLGLRRWARVAIADRTECVALSAGAYRTNEAKPAGTFTVTRSGNLSRAVSVRYALQAG